MRHWLQLATRNWRAKALRTLGAVAAITLGTASIVWVTSCYESVRRSVLRWAGDYVGSAHVTVQSALGRYDQIPARLLDAIAKVEGVRTVNGRFVQRLHAVTVRRGELGARNEQTLVWSKDVPEVDLQGVEIESELLVRDHRRELLPNAGRLITPDDEWACVINASLAHEAGVGVGDALFVWGGARDQPYRFEIVGLIQHRRVARFQKDVALVPLRTLQQMTSKSGLVTSIDVVLAQADASQMNRAMARIRAAVQPISPGATTRSVEGRMRQIEFAQSQQRLVMMLLSCVVMLSALVTILSTLSMGMIERIGQLGLMRCVGLTGGQLGLLMLLEVLPLGAVGVLAGVPLGMGMTALTVWLVPEYVGHFVVSVSGLLLAVGAGMVTALVAAVVPMAAAMTVSPLEAARPRARRGGGRALGLVFVLAVAALGVQHFVLLPAVERTLHFVWWMALSVVVLYAGYVLLAAPLVRLLSVPAVALVGGVLGLRARLLQDQVGHAVWRAAGVCCGLMVALSLIIEVFTVNESIVQGWQFPRQFPEAYVWSFDQMRPDAAAIAAQTPGVGRVTAANALNVIVQERRPLFMEQVQRSVTWFVGCDPDTFFAMVRAEMRRGDHVVVADDFARSRDRHLGDRVNVWIGDRVHNFRIAGVMQSPALDIAAGFFQAHTEFNVAASGSVLGTNADMKRLFQVDGVKMLLLDFDLPPLPPPADWPPPASGRDGELAEHLRDPRVPLERRWRNFREAQVLEEVRRRLQTPQAYIGTARELKDAIDAQLGEIVRLLVAVPSVALTVAALGVANLMMANVVARARQIAILRAVGATRGLILRMVLGEALVLGAIGVGMGLMLGLHLAHNELAVLDRIWGFRVDAVLPWGTLSVAVLVTLLLCALAGALPARYSARTNVVEALHVV
jgi:putative ABC transport system permease protein